jgi:hypothetical protein
VSLRHAAAGVTVAALAAGCAAIAWIPGVSGGKKEVWLFVATEDELDTACRGGVLPTSIIRRAQSAGVTLPRDKFDDRDVLIPAGLLAGKGTADRTEQSGVAVAETAEEMPHSCVSRRFFKNKGHEGEHPHIKLSRSLQQSAVFRSLDKFTMTVTPLGSTAGGNGHDESEVPGGQTAPASTQPTSAGPLPFDPKQVATWAKESNTHETGPIDRTGVGKEYKVHFRIGGFRIDPHIEGKP